MQYLDGCGLDDATGAYDGVSLGSCRACPASKYRADDVSPFACEGDCAAGCTECTGPDSGDCTNWSCSAGEVPPDSTFASDHTYGPATGGRSYSLKSGSVTGLTTQYDHEHEGNTYDYLVDPSCGGKYVHWGGQIGIAEHPYFNVAGYQAWFPT